MGKRYMNTVHIGKSSSLVLQPIIGLDSRNYAFPLVPVLNSGTKRSSVWYTGMYRPITSTAHMCMYTYIHMGYIIFTTHDLLE